MKQLSLSLAFFIISILAKAQNSDLSFQSDEKQFPKNEIGTNLFSIRARFPHSTFYGSFRTNYLTGLMYKHHFKKNTLRIGADYNYSNYIINRNGGSFYIRDEGKNNYGEIRAGIERRLGDKKLKPFILADLEFAYGSVQGIKQGAGDFGPPHVTEYDWDIFQYGLSAGAGLQYSLSEKFSISVESNVSFIVYENFDLGYDFGGVSYRIFYNPVSLLSINYAI